MTFVGSVHRRFSPPEDPDGMFRREIAREAKIFISHREKEIRGDVLYPCMICFIDQVLENREFDERERVPDRRPEEMGNTIHVGTSQLVAFFFRTLVYEWKIMEPLRRAYPEDRAVQEGHAILEILKDWCEKDQIPRFISTGQQSSPTIK